MEITKVERDLIRQVVGAFHTPHKKDLHGELLLHAAKVKEEWFHKARDWPALLADALRKKAINLKRNWKLRDERTGAEITPILDVAASAPPLLDHFIDQETVQRAMATLPPLVQEYWKLRAEGMRKTQAAQRIGIHRNTAPAWERLIAAALVDKRPLSAPSDCADSPARGPMEVKTMGIEEKHRTPRASTYVMIPTALVQEVTQHDFSGLQHRILWWTAGKTFGWHRTKALFSWYGVAQDLGTDRGATVRAGNKLVAADFLVIGPGKKIGFSERFALIEPEEAMPDGSGLKKAMLNDIGESDAKQHRKRCQTASVYRRAKDSSKDIKDIKAGGMPPQQEGHPAGAAKPIPGKYRDVDAGA